MMASACVIIACVIWLLYGCTPAATVARTDGFNAQWRGYSSIVAPDAYGRAKITVEIIVSDDMPEGAPAGSVATYSHPQGIIRIRGKLAGGKIIVHESVLGHEVMHALQYQAEGFVNPDKLTEMGY
jgi:hypothetical protein